MSNAWDDPRIQRGMTEQLAKRRARIAAGEQPLGWKVGFGAPAMMEKFKITAPLVGFLMQRALVPSGGSASLAGWVKPVAEPEIAVHIGRDLAGGGDRAAAAAAIAALGPAIELADADLPFEDPEAILKGNIFQRHVILGERDASRAGGNTAGLTARVFRRDARGGAHQRPGGRHGQDRRHRAPRRRPARGFRRAALGRRRDHCRLGDAAHARRGGRDIGGLCPRSVGRVSVAFTR